MSVYNGVAHLARTIDSILNQTLSDFEFIIVNDGSTDSSLSILKDYQARDQRIKVIDQQNEGLTKALNAGCSAARGEFIARQDVGDRSLPERLRKQSAILISDSRIVAVGAGARRIGPDGEYLGDCARVEDPEAVTRQLLESGIGLLHAASIFRRTAFEQVGKYRSEFRYAQDTDLWYRLSTKGLLAEAPEILFEILIETAGISGSQTATQIRLSEIARESHQLRCNGISDAECMKEASLVSQRGSDQCLTAGKNQQSAQASYFIGSQLFQLRDNRCRKYLSSAICWRGPVLPAMIKFIASFALCHKPASHSTMFNEGG